MIDKNDIQTTDGELEKVIKEVDFIFKTEEFEKKENAFYCLGI